ncbi:DUF2085 domain-containing protein [Bacillus carboniphilus]|uniref:DUF2085 domain-containing protein n=1 Tax=Bacillus carboniphilus TaxID=86663 RepID=UPI0031DF21AC
MWKDIISLQFIPCHRRKERSLVIGDFQFPICYRCMFILVGYLLLPLLFLLNIPLYCGIFLQFPMLIDGFTQAKKWRLSNNLLRSITGLMAGFGQSVIIKAAVSFLVGFIIS